MIWNVSQVRDWKTGDSLNFAFIAFEEESACVEAYKKMNNVLIDDSRIRVDFSQSVAKIWSRYTMQYKGSAAAKLREKHRGAGQSYDKPAGVPGHYGPVGGVSSGRPAPPFSGYDRKPDYRDALPSGRGRQHVADYRDRLDRRDDRGSRGREPSRRDDRDRRDDRSRSRRDRSRSRERSRRDGGR